LIFIRKFDNIDYGWQENFDEIRELRVLLGFLWADAATKYQKLLPGKRRGQINGLMANTIFQHTRDSNPVPQGQKSGTLTTELPEGTFNLYQLSHQFKTMYPFLGRSKNG
jgi:hypothetical protein